MLLVVKLPFPAEKRRGWGSYWADPEGSARIHYPSPPTPPIPTLSRIMDGVSVFFLAAIKNYHKLEFPLWVGGLRTQSSLPEDAVFNPQPQLVN